MKKIAYIYHIDNKYSYASRTIAKGFKNAFIERGDTFQFFNTRKLEKLLPIEKIKLLNYSPDIIFANVEDVCHLPLNLLKSTSLILWGSFYTPCYYEAQIHMLSEQTKKVLNKYSSKHNILIWSQHDEVINDEFYAGYHKELGLKFVQLLHCADKTQYIEPILSPEFDFIWVGNIGHRLSTYESFILPLKEKFSNYLEYTEKNITDPTIIEDQKLYQRSCIAPNIHTEAQISHQILVNERVFSSTLLGGFQICDNLLTRKYFGEQELVISLNSNDFMDKVKYYKEHPEERIQMIRRMQTNILSNHTYFNRIDTVLESLKG